jgi:hypothetical protein
MAEQTTLERHDPDGTGGCGEEKNYGDPQGITHVCRHGAHEEDAHICRCGLVWVAPKPDPLMASVLARAEKAETALDQLRAYARWCKDRSVEPDERDILNLADGKECHDYVALLRRQGAPSLVSAATGETRKDPQ